MWKEVYVYGDGNRIERYWNAGLSLDGNKCFLTDIGEIMYFIFEVGTGHVLWKNERTLSQPSILNNDNEFLSLADEPVKGDYRLFGLGINHPILEIPSIKLKINLSIDTEELILSESPSEKEIQRLKYHAFSGDWAFATFSDDGSTIAVIEPYYLTFFRDSN
jgi:hypothetical protein